AGTRLTPAHVAVLGVAGLDAVRVRRRPTVALVLTGDEVVGAGRPTPGRVRDAFDPMLPAAVHALGGDVVRVVRIGDDHAAIAAAVAGPEDVVVIVGGTGRSRVDLLRRALGDAPVAFDGVAMRPGHPTLLTATVRPVLGLPGNPLAAVAALLSFLPPILDGLTSATAAPLPTAPAAEPLLGWRGTSLVPCARTADGLVPAAGARPNMLRGLAASDVLAVVPPEGAEPGTSVRVLPLPW
ncbi:molybdopterin-binding protein, partial [Amnibacterium endophyticum]